MAYFCGMLLSFLTVFVLTRKNKTAAVILLNSFAGGVIYLTLCLFNVLQANTFFSFNIGMLGIAGFLFLLLLNR